MDLPTFLSCQPFLFPIPLIEDEQYNFEESLGSTSTATTTKNSDQWFHKMLLLRKKKNHSNKDDGLHDDDQYRNLVDEQQVLQHLFDHVVSIEPVIDPRVTNNKLRTEGGEDEHTNGDESEQEEEDEETTKAATRNSLLGPAFFLPDKERNKEAVEGSSNNVSGQDSDFGMYPIELAVWTSKNIEKDSFTHGKIAKPKKAKESNSKSSRAAAAVDVSASTTERMDDVDTVVLVKIGRKNSNNSIYQINLKFLQGIEHLHSESSDYENNNNNNEKQDKVREDKQKLPSCLLLHFPGCTFRIFPTASTSAELSSSSSVSSPTKKRKSSSSPPRIYSKPSTSSSSTDVGSAKGQHHEYLHGSSGTTTTYVEGKSRTSQTVDEAQTVIHDTLTTILRSPGDFYLPFPFVSDLATEDNTSGTAASKSYLERSLSRRRAQHSAFKEFFELESMLGSLTNEVLSTSSSSSSPKSPAMDDSLRQRLRDLIVSIPSNASASIGTRHELIKVLELHNQMIDETDTELLNIIKKFWESNSGFATSRHSLLGHGHDNHLLHKRRRFFNDGDTGGNDSTNLTVAQALHDQQECMKKTCELLEQSKKLLANKYEVLCLTQR
jgi:hypothetical protein